MRFVVQVQLYPTPEQAALLRATMERVNAASTWIAARAVATGAVKCVPLHHICYRPVREDFGLGGRAATLCIKRVADALSRRGTKRLTFRPDAAVQYDTDMLTLKPDRTFSILTLSGRTRIRYGARPGADVRRDFKVSDLVARRDGRWFLHLVYDAATPDVSPPADFIGVDMGVVNLATTSDGEVFTGADVEAIRTRFAERRRRLQREATRQRKSGKRPRNVHRAGRRAWAREGRFRRDVSHQISKHLVSLAKGTSRGIAVENLRYIRERIQFRREQRARMGGWGFAQLQGFIAYKAERAGVCLLTVGSAYTSQTCHACGHRDRANRPTQSEFVCQSCGHATNADVNAAQNIRARALAVAPKVSEPSQRIAA